MVPPRRFTCQLRPVFTSVTVATVPRENTLCMLPVHQSTSCTLDELEELDELDEPDEPDEPDEVLSVVLPSYLAALLEKSLLSVVLPALPSTVRPACFWNSITASRVLAPKSPSALPERYLSSIRRVCSVFTSLPLSPMESVPLMLSSCSSMISASVFLLGASEAKSAFCVVAPAMPSAVSPACFWKAFTASVVALPKSPSALPERYLSSIRRFCIAFTASPVEPCLSVV